MDLELRYRSILSYSIHGRQSEDVPELESPCSAPPADNADVPRAKSPKHWCRPACRRREQAVAPPAAVGSCFLCYKHLNLGRQNCQPNGRSPAHYDPKHRTGAAPLSLFLSLPSPFLPTRQSQRPDRRNTRRTNPRCATAVRSTCRSHSHHWPAPPAAAPADGMAPLAPSTGFPAAATPPSDSSWGPCMEKSGTSSRRYCL